MTQVVSNYHDLTRSNKLMYCVVYMQCDPAPSGMCKDWPYIEACQANGFITCPIAMTYQSVRAQSEVVTGRPALEIMESGVGLVKSLDNPGACKWSPYSVSRDS